MKITSFLNENSEMILEHLLLGNAKWENLVAEKRLCTPSAWRDEQLWTFLAACGYAIAGDGGVRRLTKILTGTDLYQLNQKIWLEAMPMSPRKQEGNTRLDLAVGTIRRRVCTGGGIELDNGPDSWICFCEAKVYSDLSHGVTHDLHRNQLARVAENALCFQGQGRFVDRVYVALLTPAIFKIPPAKSRLYQYKFREYKACSMDLSRNLIACSMDQRDEPDWSYPSNMVERVRRLEFRWATYEELFDNLPESAISQELRKFRDQHYMKHGNALIPSQS